MIDWRSVFSTPHTHLASCLLSLSELDTSVPLLSLLEAGLAVLELPELMEVTEVRVPRLEAVSTSTFTRLAFKLFGVETQRGSDRLLLR